MLAREQHQCEPVTIAAEGASPIARRELVTLPTAYRAAVSLDPDDSPVSITVETPARRQQRAEA